VDDVAVVKEAIEDAPVRISSPAKILGHSHTCLFEARIMEPFS
jgi:hypothetical protein